MCVEREKVRPTWTKPILGSNPEGGKWCVKQHSFDNCILLLGQMRIKKECGFWRRVFSTFPFLHFIGQSFCY